MKQFITTKMIDGLAENKLKAGDKVEIGFNSQSNRIELEVEFISTFRSGYNGVTTNAVFFKSKGTKIVVYYTANEHETTTVVYPEEGSRGMFTDDYKAENVDNGFYMCKIGPGGSKSEVDLDTLTYTSRVKRQVNTPLRVGDKFSTVNNNYEVLAIATDGSMFCQHDEGTAHVFRTNDTSLVKAMCGVTVGEPSEE